MGRPYFQEPEYTKGIDDPTDAELDRQSKLARAGLYHCNELGEILEELGLFFPLLQVIDALKELE